MSRNRPARAPQSVGLDPMTVVLAGVLMLATLCSWRIYSASASVVDLAVDKDTYTRIFVEHADGSKDVQSDNQRLADEVNSKRERLMAAQTEAVVMMVACAGIGLALSVRLYRYRKA